MRSGDRGDPARLRDVIGEVGNHLGLRRPAAVGALWARWAEIVGDEIATHAEPTSVRDGVLRVRTASPSWATEIGYLGDEICRRVNTAMDSDLIHEVRVWTGPEPINARRSETETRSPASGEVARRASAQRERSSPVEALEAARAAWRRRRAGGRSNPPRGIDRGSSEGPETPEKGS